MPFTTNKGYSVQTAGSNTGVWGAGSPEALNEGCFEVIDRNVGGLVTKSLASTPVVLTTQESQNAILRLTGTLLANVQITTSCIGFFFCENLTTGAFTVTITNGVSGVAMPQGNRATLIADSANGVRLAGTDNFSTGTRMLFFQTAAPTGWTKDTSLDNGTIRLVSGSVGADAGTANFTDVFTARTILQANLPNVNFTVTDPGHVHTQNYGAGLISVDGYDGGARYDFRDQNTTVSPSVTGISVNSGGSDTPLDFAVKYANAIRATKA